MKIHNAFRLGLIGTLGVGLGLLILISVASLGTILTYVGLALFLALGLEPAISSLERRGLRRWLAITIVLTVVLAIFLGVIFTIVPIIVDQIAQLIDRVPVIVQQIQRQDWLGALYDQFGESTVDDILANVTGFLTDPNKITELAGGLLAAGFSIVNGVFAGVIVLILTLYFAASLTSMKRAAYQLVPLTRRPRFIDLTEQITASVGRYVVGQIALAAINGILSVIFLSFIGAPFPPLLAVIAFLLSLIPLVGTLTGSAIIVLVCLIPGLGSPTTALAAAIWYLIYMQVEAYLLSPRIMTRAVQVPAALIVIAALAGATLLGVLGALVAIPLAASILLIIKQVVVPLQNER